MTLKILKRTVQLRIRSLGKPLDTAVLKLSPKGGEFSYAHINAYADEQGRESQTESIANVKGLEGKGSLAYINNLKEHHRARSER